MAADAIGALGRRRSRRFTTGGSVARWTLAVAGVGGALFAQRPESVASPPPDHSPRIVEVRPTAAAPVEPRVGGQPGFFQMDEVSVGLPPSPPPMSQIPSGSLPKAANVPDYSAVAADEFMRPAATKTPPIVQAQGVQAQGVQAQGVQAPNAKPDVQAPAVPIEPLPAPRAVSPSSVPPKTLPGGGIGGSGFGRTPEPTPKDIQEMNAFVEKFVDPRNLIELVRGRVRLLMLKEAPKRVQIGDPNIADYTFVGNKAMELSLGGRTVGTTVLNLWFDDPAQKGQEKILSILVRVIPDPEERERLENVYRALEKEINQNFPDSVVHLKLLGDKLMVTGQAHDSIEATQILRILRANAPGSNQDRGGGNVRARTPTGAKIPLGLEPTARPDDPGLEEEQEVPGLEDYHLTGGPNVINMMRVPGDQQVMLKVSVAEVNRSAARSIGVNFSITNNQGITVFQQRTGAIGTVAGAAANAANAANGAIGAGAINNLPIALDNGQIAIAINALRTLNYARSLAEPNLVTLNGKTATFLAGGEFPVPVVTGNTLNGLQGVTYVPFGVRLNFTPYITDKDRIRLNLLASVSTRDVAIGTQVGNSNVSGLNARRFRTMVELREGQTLAVAGLIQNNLGADATRVPFFGDLPIIGRLAGFDRISHADQELVVLVTPQLVHPMGAKEVPPLPGSDIFEPNDIEFYLLGRLESHRGADYRSPVMTDWSRLRQNNRIECFHLFGASGYAGEAPVAP